MVLHEAAHAWFNGNLLADRWALEAFASYYALEAAADLKVKAKGDELTDELRKSKIPLNAWGPIGREERGTEDYAYAATLEVARQIAERAGEEGLQEVWQAAADKAGAYQPPAGTEAATAGTSGAGGTPDAAEPERVLGPPDWRGLIDLLEEHTDQTYEDLWREWIIRPEDAPLLAERAEAREHYDAVIDEAAGWSLPRPIRDAMRAWQFDTAGGLLDEAAAVLEQRDAIARAAADADLTPPDNLRAAFEGNDGFDDARAEIDQQLDVIDRYADAVALRPVNPDVFTQLGLYEETPEADLEEAATAYAAGDLDGSAAAADEARLTWISAADVGRTRAVVIALIAIAILLLVVLSIAAIVRLRRGRRGGPALAAATAEAGAVPAAGDPDPTDVVVRERSFHPQTARLSVPPRPASRFGACGTLAASYAGREPRRLEARMGWSAWLTQEQECVADGHAARASLERDPLRRFRRRLLRASRAHPRGRRPRSARDDGGLHPP